MVGFSIIHTVRKENSRRNVADRVLLSLLDCLGGGAGSGALGGGVCCSGGRNVQPV